MFLSKEAILRIAPEHADPGHLSGDQLERYFRISTPLEQVAQIEEHLFVCEECQASLHKLDEYSTIMREALVAILSGRAVFKGREGTFDGWKSAKWR